MKLQDYTDDDKEYIGREQQINLLKKGDIDFEVPMRNNQKEQKPTLWILEKSKKKN